MLRSLLRVSAVVLCVCIPAAVFAQGEIRRPAERPVDPTCSSSSAPTRSALAGAVLTCTDATVYVGNGSSWTKLGSGGGSITGSDTQVLFFDGADNPAGSSLFRFVKDFFGSPVVYFTSSDVSGAYTELNIFAQDTTDHQESPNLFIAANNGTPGAGGGGMFLTGLGSNYNNVDLLNLVSSAVIRAQGTGGFALTAEGGPIRMGAGGYDFAHEFVRIVSTGVIGVGPFPSISTLDLGIKRNAAGVLEVNTGTSGTFADVKAAHFIVAGLTTPANKPVCFDANGQLFAGTNTGGVLSCP